MNQWRFQQSECRNCIACKHAKFSHETYYYCNIKKDLVPAGGTCNKFEGINK